MAFDLNAVRPRSDGKMRRCASVGEIADAVAELIVGADQ